MRNKKEIQELSILATIFWVFCALCVGLILSSNPKATLTNMCIAPVFGFLVYIFLSRKKPSGKRRKGKHRRIISIAAIVGVVAVAGLVCYGLCPQRVKADLKGPIQFDVSEEGVVDNIEIYKEGKIQVRTAWDPWWYSCYVYEFTSGETITVKFNLKWPWVLMDGDLTCPLWVVHDNIRKYPSDLPDGFSTIATFENLTVPQEWNDTDCHHLYWDADTGVVEWLEY